MSASTPNDLIYLDNAATSWPKPPQVAEASARAYSILLANAGRSGHKPSLEAARFVFEIRERLARLFGIADSRNLVFTRGTTEGINLVLKGFLHPGDTVALSPMEHNAAVRPLAGLESRIGVRSVTLPGDRYGRIDVATAAGMFPEPPRLVCVSAASNVNGTVQDIAALRRTFPLSAILVDAAQTAGVTEINIDRDGIDFLCASAHKGMLGPTGIGFCYLSPKHDIPPLIEGGTGSSSADSKQPTTRPDRYESGTQNLHGMHALSGALEHLDKNGLCGEHKKALTRQILKGISDVRTIHSHSPDDGTALHISMTVDGIPPDMAARILEEEHGILCRPGIHCSPMSHRHLGTFPQGTLRLSPGWATTEEDIHRTVEALIDIASRDTLRVQPETDAPLGQAQGCMR